MLYFSSFDKITGMNGFNDGLLCSGETVAVALSGGEDSVCLLHLLKQCEKIKNIKVVAVNVEHGIRGESSKRDTAFCIELCKDLSVPIKVYSVSAPSLVEKEGLSLEEAARNLRYDCFYDAVKIGFCNKIACAHHQDDNVETVLFNLFRGASVSGLRGMEEASLDGVIIRPLLRAKKLDITKYVNDNGLKYVTDESNDDTFYTRNFIRKKVLPLVSERFVGVKDAIEKLSFSAKSDDAYLYKIAKENLTFKNGACYIKTSLPYPIFSRAAILALKTLGVKKDFDNGHIAALFALNDNISGKKVDLLGGLYGIKEHDCIVIKKKVPKEDFSAEFKLGKTTVKDGFIDVEKTDGYKKDDANYVDYDKIPVGAVIRKRKVGDVFYKFGGGKSSLKKFLTDKKIPSDEKDELYLIAKDDVVYVVVGVEISSLCKIDEKTVNAVRITVSKRSI